jgi:hypothetical protein
MKIYSDANLRLYLLKICSEHELGELWGKRSYGTLGGIGLQKALGLLTL